MNEVLGPVVISGHVGRTHNYFNAKWLNCGIMTDFCFENTKNIRKNKHLKKNEGQKNLKLYLFIEVCLFQKIKDRLKLHSIE